MRLEGGGLEDAEVDHQSLATVAADLIGKKPDLSPLGVKGPKNCDGGHCEFKSTCAGALGPPRKLRRIQDGEFWYHSAYAIPLRDLRA